MQGRLDGGADGITAPPHDRVPPASLDVPGASAAGLTSGRRVGCPVTCDCKGPPSREGSGKVQEDGGAWMTHPRFTSRRHAWVSASRSQALEKMSCQVPCGERSTIYVLCLVGANTPQTLAPPGPPWCAPPPQAASCRHGLFLCTECKPQEDRTFPVLLATWSRHPDKVPSKYRVEIVLPWPSPGSARGGTGLRWRPRWTTGPAGGERGWGPECTCHTQTRARPCDLQEGAARPRDDDDDDDVRAGRGGSWGLSL